MPLTDRVFPFLRWSPHHGDVLRADFWAGLTVAMVLIPQSMAYAQLAGMPAHYGLYAGFLPVIVAALWGSCYQLSTGPVALISILTGAALTQFAAPGTDAYISYALFLSLIAGSISLIIGIFRLGVLINFISYPVLIGFTNAAALIIACSQFNKFLGLKGGGSGAFLATFAKLFARLGETHLPTLALGLAALALMAVLRKLSSKLPGALLATVITSAAAFYLGLQVDLVGAIPQGLPHLGFPSLPWEKSAELMPSALMLTLLGVMEVCSISKAIALRTRQRIDLNQELIGQGLANLAGWVTQSFPVSGSFSRSALNLGAGARTGMSSVFTGLFVLLMLLFLTPLLAYLPQVTLAAIILATVVRLINFAEMREAWHVHPHDGTAALVTFLATLILAPSMEYGILIGIALSIALYLYRTMHPRVAMLGRHPDGTYRDAELHKLRVVDWAPAMRFDGRLYFANAATFEEAILEIRTRFPSATHILVSCDGINELDASGEWVLRDLVKRLREAEVTLVLVGVKAQITQVMQSTGLDQIVGEKNIFRTEDEAYAALAERLAIQKADLPSSPRESAEQAGAK